MKQTINDMIKSDKIKYDDLEVVGYIGCLGSGKSFQTEKLIKEGYYPIAFADELRNKCWEFLSWNPKNDEEYENFKAGNVFIDLFGGFVNGRAVLQQMGQLMRMENKNYWVDKLKQRIDLLYKLGYNKIVVTDIRHENELELIKSYNNSKVIFCDYKSERYDCSNTHISEQLAQKYLSQGYIDGQQIILECYNSAQ